MNKKLNPFIFLFEEEKGKVLSDKMIYDTWTEFILDLKKFNNRDESFCEKIFLVHGCRTTMISISIYEQIPLHQVMFMARHKSIVSPLLYGRKLMCNRSDWNSKKIK